MTNLPARQHGQAGRARVEFERAGRSARWILRAVPSKVGLPRPQPQHSASSARNTNMRHGGRRCATGRRTAVSSNFAHRRRTPRVAPPGAAQRPPLGPGLDKAEPLHSSSALGPVTPRPHRPGRHRRPDHETGLNRAWVARAAAAVVARLCRLGPSRRSIPWPLSARGLLPDSNFGSISVTCPDSRTRRGSALPNGPRDTLVGR